MRISFLSEMQQYKGFGVRAVNVRVSLKIRRVQHGEFRGVLRQFVQIQFANKHGAGKQGGGGAFANDANGKTRNTFVRSRVAVLNKNIFPLEVRAQPGLESVELRRVQRAIDFSQQILLSLEGSRTRNLSFGKRPVYWPVRTTSGPR